MVKLYKKIKEKKKVREKRKKRRKKNKNKSKREEESENSKNRGDKCESEPITSTPPVNKVKVKLPRHSFPKGKVSLRSTLFPKKANIGIRRTIAGAIASIN